METEDSIDSELILTSTTEFVKNIQPIEEILSSTKITSKISEKNNMDLETIVEEDIADHEKMIREQAMKERKVTFYFNIANFFYYLKDKKTK